LSPIKPASPSNARLVRSAQSRASNGGRGLAGVLLGSETQKVLVHSSIPVLVYR
jgi:nucleotide-binding universal stress UspA family protein